MFMVEFLDVSVRVDHVAGVGLARPVDAAPSDFLIRWPVSHWPSGPRPAEGTVIAVDPPLKLTWATMLVALGGMLPTVLDSRR